MISDERAKQILNSGKRKYTDKEVKAIKDMLGQIIEVDIKKWKNEKRNSVRQGLDR